MKFYRALKDIFSNDPITFIRLQWLQKLTSLFALFLLFAPAYGTYTRFNDGILSAEWSKPEQVMWDTFSRTSWALGVSWFIMIGSTGNAGKCDVKSGLFIIF